MGKKGIKSSKGQGEEWDEPKSERLSLKLTPQGKRLLQERANSLGISISELIERMVRGGVDFSNASTIKDRLPTIDQVKSAITRFSGSAIADIVIFAVDAMRKCMRSPDHMPEPKETIAQLIEEYWDTCLSELEGAIAHQRLQELRDGAKPSLRELEPLSSVLPHSLEELEIIWRRDFKNGENHIGCRSSN
jgi:hypothetical protein